jgi:alpha-mannosidase
VKSGQLEFINGGWCMHDEASPYYVEMVDQTTRGHQFLKKYFGSDAIPRGTWQIDPFGHSNTQAWLLGAEAGMESMFWGRTDYQDFAVRKNTSRLEWIWQGSQSLGKTAQIFAGELYGGGGGGYGTWIGFDGPNNQVQDDPSRHDYNVDKMVDQFVQDALSQAEHTATVHQMWACGSDFQYQNADHWYHNLDKLMHYVNQNGTVNAFYSTPTFYVEQKKKAQAVWEVREDDIFPLADAAHNYWSGYFTSRPALKKQVHTASSFLNSARQVEVISGVTAAEVDTPTTRPSPPVGKSWTDSLEGTIGVATHHDGMSGTERQDVADDYAQRMSESHTEVEQGFALSLATMMGQKDIPFNHCNCNAVGAENCLNITVCPHTTGVKGFTVVAYNQLGQAATEIIRVPVTGDSWTVTDISTGEVLDGVQVDEIDQRTLSLPLLYINYAGIKKEDVPAVQKAYSNKATHVISFAATSLPPMGYASFEFTSASDSASMVALTNRAMHRVASAEADTVVNGSVYSLTIDGTTGLVKSITNMKNGKVADFSIEWGWYNSSVGGCTPGIEPYGYSCSGQKSGAYIFRPNSSNFYFPGKQQKPIVEISEGPLMVEIQQTFSEWASHVIRLPKTSSGDDDLSYVEVEWTAGPIPIDTPWFAPVAKGKDNIWGKEVSVRYSSSLKSAGTFYTDSNGREMVKRQYNARGPSYPKLNVSEPVAGNYYPVNSMISLQDTQADAELCIITDVTQGGASLADGQMELMVHRRIQDDDSRGVQEPLNETMCGCNDINAAPGTMGAHGKEGDGGCECAGLTMRGRHWIIFDSVERTNAARRRLSERLNFPATLAFSAPNAVPKASATKQTIAEALPDNVKLMTLTNNYEDINDGKMLLRLSHLYSVGEHPTLSQPATVSLASVFAKAGLTIATAEEVSLTANQPIQEMDANKYVWKTETDSGSSIKRKYLDPKDPTLTVSLRPMELKTYLVTFQ